MNLDEATPKELKQDLTDAINDNRVCEAAKQKGITGYAMLGKQVEIADRINANNEVIEAITAELKKRGLL